jgi:hypothetical protein
MSDIEAGQILLAGEAAADALLSVCSLAAGPDLVASAAIAHMLLDAVVARAREEVAGG